MGGSCLNILSIIQVSRTISLLLSPPKLPRDLKWWNSCIPSLQLFNQSHEIREVIYKTSDNWPSFKRDMHGAVIRKATVHYSAKLAASRLRSMGDRYWLSDHPPIIWLLLPHLPRASKEPPNDQLQGLFSAERNMVFL